VLYTAKTDYPLHMFSSEILLNLRKL